MKTLFVTVCLLALTTSQEETKNDQGVKNTEEKTLKKRTLIEFANLGEHHGFGDRGFEEHHDFQGHQGFGGQQALEEGHGFHHEHVKTITIEKKVPVPYHVTVYKKVAYPVKVPVDKPYPVHVPKPYPVYYEKKVPYKVKEYVPSPYTVYKKIPYSVKVHIDKPYTVHVPKPYPVYVEKKVPYTVEKHVPYTVKVPVDKPYPVHYPVYKHIPYTVEKKVPYKVEVPVEKPVPVEVPKPYPVYVEKKIPYTVEKPVPYPVKVPVHVPVHHHKEDHEHHENFGQEQEVTQSFESVHENDGGESGIGVEDEEGYQHQGEQYSDHAKRSLHVEQHGASSNHQKVRQADNVNKEVGDQVFGKKLSSKIFSR